MKRKRGSEMHPLAGSVQRGRSQDCERKKASEPMALTSCEAQRESLGQEQGKKASEEYSRTGGHGRNKSGHRNRVRER